jgi:redox-sensitive bicupin YhaK (pirin superfamily)
MSAASGIALALKGHSKDLGGGFLVRRLLPAAQRQSVGPFLFFDHFGPVEQHPADNHDVRPHPHIGLATVTYLFEGAMMHRDSVGSVQRIEPGAINWMTAGRGVVHSERTPDDLRQVTRRSHGIQLWAALPTAYEEAEPSFEHTPAHAIPGVVFDDAQIRVLIGSAFGCTSPVNTFAPTLYLDIRFPAAGSLTLASSANTANTERAIYCVDADLLIDGEPLPACTLGVFTPGATVRVQSGGPAQCVLIGGAPLDGHRHMWWNFVSSRKERILQAADDWAAQRMGQVPGETEFIPLPEKRLPPDRQ